MEKEYRKCFVAVLDILGFKDLIEEQRDPSYIADMLKRLKGQVGVTTGVNEQNRTPRINYILVSDTLLLYSEEDDFESFKCLVENVAYTIYSGLGSIASLCSNLAVPMLFRGAISWDDFYFDSTDNIYFGSSYIESLAWEKKQEWIGAILTPACSAFIKSKNFNMQDLLLVEYEAPIKELIIEDNQCKNVIKTQKELCVNWTKEFCKQKAFKGLDWSRYGRSEKIKGKIKYTNNFFEFLKK